MSSKKDYDKVTMREGRANNRELGKGGTKVPRIIKKLGERTFDARAKGEADYRAAQKKKKGK